MQDPVRGEPAGGGHLAEALSQLNQHALDILYEDPSVAAQIAEKAVNLAASKLIDNPASTDGQPAYLHLLHGTALQTLGRAYNLQGEYAKGLDAFRRGIEAFTKAGEPGNLAECLSFSAVCFLYLGDHARSLETMFSALKMASKAGAGELEAEIMNDIGYTYCQLKEYQSALPYLEYAVKAFRDSADLKRLAWALDSMSQAYTGLKELDKALLYSREARLTSEQVGDWNSVTEQWISMGDVYYNLGDLEHACTCYTRSIHLARQHGYRRNIALALFKLGVLCNRRRDPQESIRTLKEALLLAEATSTKNLMMECYRALADAYKATMDYGAALEMFEKSFELNQELYNEEANRRVKNLEVMNQLERARQQAEIFELRNIALTQEVEEHKRTQARLEQLANTDALTGLLNRRYFYEIGEPLFQRARISGDTTAIILFDVDHFKNFNDTYGHLAGDHALVEIAERTRLVFRSEDIIARFGGEEFIIMLPVTDAASAYQAAERLRQKIISNPFPIKRNTAEITISIGVAVDNGEAELTLEKMIDRADMALYRAKRSGRNRVKFYRGTDGRA